MSNIRKDILAIRESIITIEKNITQHRFNILIVITDYSCFNYYGKFNLKFIILKSNMFAEWKLKTNTMIGMQKSKLCFG